MLTVVPLRRRQWMLGATGAALAAPWPLRVLANGAATSWLDGGRATPLAREAVALLNAADDDGLDPRDYGAEALARAVAAADTAPLPTAAAARLDGALTTAMQQFLHDLAHGRIDPRRIHQRYRVAARSDFDAATALQTALARGRLADAVRAAQPPLPLYGQLRAALAAYRALGSPRAWAQPLPPLPVPRGSRAGKLEPGQPWSGLPLLVQRLQVLGDLAVDVPVPPRYEGAVVDAVRAFQQRHGLAVDGVVGRATAAALDVTPAARARQIELTMERLRWTPLMQAPRMIVVNVPEFELRAYEVVDGRIHVREQMRVIVGRALDTRTPLFDETMRFIEFAPYWNVPPSIARNETVPRLRRDPGYWQREGFEFVTPDGRVDTVLTADKLDAVLAGRLRIRQRPGERNALGDIKFVFPNNDNIFLHHTPGVALFERERRDFSHGCIRVEKPVELARFVMAGMPGWDEARIREAMAGGTSTTVRLAAPVPVLIAYGTVLVKNGRVHFYDDLYGHDARLDAALRSRASPAHERRSPFR